MAKDFERIENLSERKYTLQAVEMERRKFTAAASAVAIAGLSPLIAACVTTEGSGADSATTRQAINEDVDSALTRLFREVHGSQELVNLASGVLVFPAVASAGGEGALRESGQTSAFYRMTAVAVSLGGGQWQAVFVLFMTPQALSQFKASSSWTAGVDGSITLINAGASTGIDAQSVREPIVGFARTNTGLMPKLSLNGNRFTRIRL